MPENAESSIVSVESRELPARITIPPIRGEMVHLRPATVADLDRMDAIDAYPGASGITGKDRVAERKTSKEAWWRTLGRGRKRDMEGK